MATGNQINSSSLPSAFNELGYGKIFGVPYLGIITIVCVIIAIVLAVPRAMARKTP